jgi:hypothetical protein
VPDPGILNDYLSVLWKAEVRNGKRCTDDLNLDRIMAIFTADLRYRGIDFQIPADPLADTAWILPVQKIYAPTPPADWRGLQHHGHLL